MTALAQIEQTLTRMAETVDRAPQAPRESHSGTAAFVAFAEILSTTILPRRVTLHAQNGARLSVIAKNRRVVKIAEVHPAEHWQGSDTAQDTACTKGYDDFGKAFALAIVAVAGNTQSRIEQALLVDPLGATKPGYPATLIAEHIEEAQKPEPRGAHIAAFFDDHPSMPRARFGAETVIEIPEGSTCDEDWMRALVTDQRDTVLGTDQDLRLTVFDGDAPYALALAWFDGEGAVILCQTPDDIDTAERHLTALRQYL